MVSLGFEGKSLTELFDTAEQLFLNVEQGDQNKDVVTHCLQLYIRINDLLRTNSVFSKNEDISELSTRRLSYLLTSLRLGQLQNYVKVDVSDGPSGRLTLLQTSDAYLDTFLRQTINHSVAEQPERDRWDRWCESQGQGQNTTTTGKESGSTTMASMVSSNGSASHQHSHRHSNSTAVGTMSRDTVQEVLRARKIEAFQRQRSAQRTKKDD